MPRSSLTCTGPGTAPGGPGQGCATSGRRTSALEPGVALAVSDTSWRTSTVLVSPRGSRRSPPHREPWCCSPTLSICPGIGPVRCHSWPTWPGGPGATAWSPEIWTRPYGLSLNSPVEGRAQSAPSSSHAVFGGAGSQQRWYEINVNAATLIQSGVVTDPSLYVFNGGSGFHARWVGARFPVASLVSRRWTTLRAACCTRKATRILTAPRARGKVFSIGSISKPCQRAAAGSGPDPVERRAELPDAVLLLLGQMEHRGSR